MPDCFEDLCPVGECVVCEGFVDERDAGYCETCSGVFHWSHCGTWYGNKHMCENCQEDIEAES